MRGMDNPFKQFRDARKLKQAQAAALLGVNKSTYLRWERGDSKPNLTTLGELSKKMGISRKRLRPDIYGAV